MIYGCFSLVKGLPSLFKNVVELGPKFQPATLGFVQTLVLRNVFYRFDKVVWLFDDFELGSRFGVSDFIGVNLNQEKRNAIIRVLVEPFNGARMFVAG